MFYSRQGNFLCACTLGLTQTPIKWVLGVQRSEREADYSPPDVEMCGD